MVDVCKTSLEDIDGLLGVASEVHTKFINTQRNVRMKHRYSLMKVSPKYQATGAPGAFAKLASHLNYWAVEGAAERPENFLRPCTGLTSDTEFTPRDVRVFTEDANPIRKLIDIGKVHLDARELHLTKMLLSLEGKNNRGLFAQVLHE